MRKRGRFEKQVSLLSLAASVPFLCLALWAMGHADISIWLILLTALLGSIVITYTHHRIHQRLAYKFRSLTNLLDGIAQGEYSLRARSDPRPGESGELMATINRLATNLSEQRRESVENQLLARLVIDHIDVAIVALGSHNQISFVNPAARSLLRLDCGDSNGALLKQLSFVDSLSIGSHQVVELSLGGQQGRFNVHVQGFRESGMQNKLLFITDVGTLLRSEERKAWQRLVRVISHEINNSLSPIASISQTLHRSVSRQETRDAQAGNLLEGLSLIAERANGLKQFVGSYRRLAKLPEPEKQMVSILGLVQKSGRLFVNQTIRIESESDVQLFVDPFQFEQVLINLFKNAVEAMSQRKPDGIISIEWRAMGSFLKISILDEGSGIGNPDNLFVPFYTTKDKGSGIGLVLCRQIVEAHNGRLSIANRTDSKGCIASIEVPLS
jgi:two-component system, NtrC family, nitrogen regulation sensor histidine kinase NtrY